LAVAITAMPRWSLWPLDHEDLSPHVDGERRAVAADLENAVAQFVNGRRRRRLLAAVTATTAVPGQPAPAAM
jgi:hypothetical protein